MSFSVNLTVDYQSYVNVDFPYIEIPAGTPEPVNVLMSFVTGSIVPKLKTGVYGQAISFCGGGNYVIRGSVADVNAAFADLVFYPGSYSESFSMFYSCSDATGSSVGFGPIYMNGSKSRPDPVVTQNTTIVTGAPSSTSTVDVATVVDPSDGFLYAAIQFNRISGDPAYSANPIIKSGVEAAVSYATIAEGYYGNSKSKWNSGVVAVDPNYSGLYPIWSIYGPHEEVDAALRNLQFVFPASRRDFSIYLQVANNAGSIVSKTYPVNAEPGTYTMTATLPTTASSAEDGYATLVGSVTGNTDTKTHTLTYTFASHVKSVSLVSGTSVTSVWDPATKKFTVSGVLAPINTALSNGIKVYSDDDYNGTITGSWVMTVGAFSSLTQGGSTTITVSAVNDAPKFTSTIPEVIFYEDSGAITRTATAIDPDAGQTITGYTLSANSLGITINSSTGVISIPATVVTFSESLSDTVANMTVTATSSDSTTVTTPFKATFKHKVTLAQTFTL